MDGAPQTTGPLGRRDAQPGASVDGAALRPAPAPAGGTPVLLVHGYGSHRSTWAPLAAHLRRAGYAHIGTLDYRAWGGGVARLAAQLVVRADVARSRAGSPTIHLIGHSLGGVVVRYAVTELGLDVSTATAISIGSPHRGANLANLGAAAQRCGFRNAAADIAPGSRVLAQLDRYTGSSSVRWTAYYSGTDRVVPGDTGRLTLPSLRARNIHVDHAGHIGMLFDRRLFRSVDDELQAADATAPTGRLLRIA